MLVVNLLGGVNRKTIQWGVPKREKSTNLQETCMHEQAQKNKLEKSMHLDEPEEQKHQ